MAGEVLAHYLDLTLGLYHHFPLYNLEPGPSIHLTLIPVWNKQTLYNTFFTAQLEWGFVTPFRQQGSEEAVLKETTTRIAIIITLISE